MGCLATDGVPLRRGGDPATSRFEARPLDTCEGLFHSFNALGAFVTTQALEVRGPLSAPLLREAFAHLERRHPLLGARIVHRAGVPWWEPAPPGPAPIAVLGAGASTSLERLAEAQLHERFGLEAERVWRCTFSPAAGAGPHRVVLTVNHAAADGISGITILRDLVATCAALRGRGELPPLLPPGPYLDQILAPTALGPRVQHALTRLWQRVSSSGPTHRAPGSDTRRTRAFFGSLPSSTFSAVVARARAEGASVSGVVTAAMLSAVREVLGPLGRIPVSHAVSLRGRGAPAEHVGCFAGSVLTTHSIRRGRQVWDLAREVSARLGRTVRDGRAGMALHATRGKPHARVHAQNAAASSHARATTLAGTLSISSRGRFAPLDAGEFAVESWYPCTANHVIGHSLQLSCASFDPGRFFFGLGVVAPVVSPEEGRALADAFSQVLAALA